jgi:hypothetical protein
MISLPCTRAIFVDMPPPGENSKPKVTTDAHG